MRVLHLDSGREMRGGQWQVFRLIEGLAAAGVESTLLARDGGPLFETAPRQAGAWSRWASRARLALARAATTWCTLTIRAATPWRRSLRARAAGGLAARGLRRRGSALQDGSTDARRHYLAVSEHVKSILAAGGVPADKIERGVRRRAAARRRRRRRRAVLAPANLDDPQKGAALALEAARLAGVELKLSNDLERDLASAAIFVYITHSEGLGSAVLLAMSAGVPVVASRRRRPAGNRAPRRDRPAGGEPRRGHRRRHTPLLRRPARWPCAWAPPRADAWSSSFTVEAMVRRTMEVYRQVLS